MELTLSTGARLTIRPMSTHVYQSFSGREEAKLEKAPLVPIVKQKSIAGHKEEVPAGEGTPEYDAWAVQMDAWSEKDKKARAAINIAWAGLVYDYGIVKWDLGAGWCEEAPDEWTYAPALLRAGLEPSDNRRLDYILLEVVIVPTDYYGVLRAIQQAAAPITQEEVEAQMAGFRARRAAAAAARNRHQAVSLPRGGGSRRGSWHPARWVGRTIKSLTRRDDSVSQSKG